MGQKKGAIKQWIMIPINKHMDYCIDRVLQTVDCILRYFEIGLYLKVGIKIAKNSRFCTSYKTCAVQNTDK